MSSQDNPSHPQTEDDETKLIIAREKLFKDAMKGRWALVADTYGQDKKVHETKITWAGDTLLHLAVSSGVEENVTLLMDYIKKEPEEYGRKILGIQNERGDTALHIAAALGMVGVCLDMAKLHPTMVVRSLNRRKETPLFKAVRHGQKKAFFALHFVVETHIKPSPSVTREGLRREGGDTILHNAIFAEHFDLAFEIIHCYPVLVNAMNEKGESPLHVVANKPSAFKSGSRFSLYDSTIYYCIFVDPLKVKYPRYEKQFIQNERMDKEKAMHNGNNKIPDNYQACYNIFTLLKDVFKNIDAVPSIGTIDEGDPENGVKAQQNHPRCPKNYYTCFDFFKLVMKFLLIIIGIGLWRVQAMMKKKQTNTHAYQIMEELVERIQKESHYGIDGMKPKMTQEESVSTIAGGGPPKVADDANQPTTQPIQDGLSKQEAEISPKQVEDDSKQKPVGATPILVAAKRGVIEMVKKILEDMPVAALDQDQDEKNIVLLAVENRQPRVYELMLKRKLMKTTVFSAVDKEGNSALHLAARLGSNRPWLIPGAALQMQWEIKWYKYVLKSMGPEFFMQHNMKGETALEIFTSTHESLVKDAGKWLNNTSQSCSVVAALIATVAFASATTVPGGVNQESGFPIFEGKPAFQVFALSALIALCFSVTSMVMFLSILTSRFQERDFERDLPAKLIIGLTTLFMSIGANLVSFCAGHFFVIEQKLKYAAYPIYAIVCLPISFFAVAQFPLYIDLIKATFAEVPERTQKLHPF